MIDSFEFDVLDHILEEKIGLGGDKVDGVNEEEVRELVSELLEEFCEVDTPDLVGVD